MVLAYAFLRVEAARRSRCSTSGSFATGSSPGPTFITVAAFFAFGGFIYENTLFLERGRGYWRSPRAS